MGKNLLGLKIQAQKFRRRNYRGRMWRLPGQFGGQLGQFERSKETYQDCASNTNWLS